MTTGFYSTPSGIQIDKDAQAVLTYNLDWSQWLQAGDSLSTVQFAIQTRSNDPAPLTTSNSGILGSNTFITLESGQVGKVYTVTAKVTTANGFTDRRTFRVNVMNRFAS
jgi:hypothetical protein